MEECTTVGEGSFIVRFLKNVDYTSDVSIAGLQKAVDEAKKKPIKSLFILLAESSLPPLSDLDKFLKQLDIPVFGGIFPQIIHQQHHHEHGALICGLKREVVISITPEISRWRDADDSPAVDLDHLSDDCAGVMVLVDGLSPGVDPFIEQLYSYLGPDKKVIGGGAGSLALVQKPCLLCNEGLLEDAALLVGFKSRLAIGVSHGWQKVAGPFLVTHAHENTVQTLDYRPAFDLYREIVESMTTERFSEQDFFSIAKVFPFGMEKLDQEVLIRDPIQEKDGSLVCVGRVPENTLVYIMRGVPDALVESAGTAAIEVIDQCCIRHMPMETLLFDCISRVLFLEKRIDEELANIFYTLPDQSTMVGAFSLGEIASSPWGGIRFLNKTTVISTLTE